MATERRYTRPPGPRGTLVPMTSQRTRSSRQLRRLGMPGVGAPPARITVTQEKAIRAAWAKLPRIECAGLCRDTCTSIRMTTPEHALTERHGIRIPDRTHRDGIATCEALTMFGQCAVYDDRPTIYRLWGLVESMPCTYGCRPEGGLLTDKQGFGVLADVYEAAGEDPNRVALLRSRFDTPEGAAATSKLMREHVTGEYDNRMAARRLLGEVPHPLE